MGKNKKLTDLVSCFMILQLHSELCSWISFSPEVFDVYMGSFAALDTTICSAFKAINNLFLIVYLSVDRYQIRAWSYCLHTEIVCYGMGL